MRTERVAHESAQIDRAEVAAAIIRQWLLATRVGGLDGFAVGQIVVAVDFTHEQHARLGVIVSGFHDLPPQIARFHLAIHPQSVGALIITFEHARIRLLRMHQFPIGIGLHRLHEGVGYADGNIEIAQIALILGVNEFLNIRMIAVQNAHLRTATRAGRLDRFA